MRLAVTVTLCHHIRVPNYCSQCYIHSQTTQQRQFPTLDRFGRERENRRREKEKEELHGSVSVTDAHSNG